MLGDIIIRYSSLASTNDEAAARAFFLPEGAVITARAQTRGKGRLGRSWESPERGGLYFSVILKPNGRPENVSSLSLAAGVAVRRALAEVSGLEPLLKWPNDVLTGGRKICGILLETSAAAFGPKDGENPRPNAERFPGAAPAGRTPPDAAGIVGATGANVSETGVNVSNDAPAGQTPTDADGIVGATGANVSETGANVSNDAPAGQMPTDAAGIVGATGANVSGIGANVSNDAPAGQTPPDAAGDTAGIARGTGVNVSNDALAGRTGHCPAGIICGIGVNVSNDADGFSPGIAGKAASLFMEKGVRFSADEVMYAILRHFDAVYRVWLAEGFAALKGEYAANCVHFRGGRAVTVRRGGEPAFSGIAEDVTEDGALVVVTDAAGFEADAAGLYAGAAGPLEGTVNQFAGMANQFAAVTGQLAVTANPVTGTAGLPAGTAGPLARTANQFAAVTGQLAGTANPV
ncbi:MAG: biotin--[acetyl-CoA-carboxylase] ligase, partial [Firmicutes bacterium]|nr:biotin--[acetyl-CoA-carboxylase] ligase [Bacillota bacterium]